MNTIIGREKQIQNEVNHSAHVTIKVGSPEAQSQGPAVVLQAVTQRSMVPALAVSDYNHRTCRDFFWPSKKSFKENVLLLIRFLKLKKKKELWRPYKMDF